MLESALLYPPPRSLDAHSYPLLSVKSATITRPPTARSATAGPIVDLFTVLRDGPFRVSGTLGAIPRKHHDLVRIDAALRKPAITIPKVETYSIERKKKRDGTSRIVIWVLGASAWFEIAPSEEYAEVFEEMKRKAEVWMWLQQVWGGRKDAEVGEIFKEYAQDHPDECRTARAAGKLINNYWKFLVQMMIESDEMDEWRDSSLWRDFEITYKDELSEILASANIASPQTRARTPRTPAPRTRRTRRANKEKTKSASPPPEADPTSTAHETSSQEESSSSESESEESPVKTPYQASSGRGKTVSAKAHSILRPAHRSDIPLAPPSPPSENEFPTPAPVGKRKQPPELESGDHEGEEHEDTAAAKRPAFHAGTDRDWTCSQCGYMVPNARTRDGRNIVNEHYKTHAGVFVEAMRTVEMEKVRGTAKRKVGVDNLLAKLNEMNRQWEEGRPSPLKGLD